MMTGAPIRTPAENLALEQAPCNLCGSSTTKLLYQSQDFRYRIDQHVYDVVRCVRCGLAFVDPRPTPEAIGRYYPSRYYERRDDAVDSARYSWLAEYLDDLTLGRLLDVGCARGGFLSEMARRGWNVAGVEPFLDDASAYGIAVYPDLQDQRLKPGSFDAVTAWSVFEHFHDPMAAFARVAELLVPEGRLVLHVPNLRSIFSRFSYQEDVPRHLYFFSEDTLRRYAEAVGLRLASVAHDTRILDGSGRGFLKLRLFELFGVSKVDYFAWGRLPGRAARWRARPALCALSQPVGMIERAVCAAPVRRIFRINGYIVATFERLSG